MKVKEVADHVAATLAQHSAGVMYGLPGGGNNLEVIGAAQERGVRFVLGHTETAAAIMAGVHAELTDKICACLVTRGPGAASAVNGVAQAMLDRQPLLMLTDVVSAADAPTISHQLLDQRAMFAPISKWATTVGNNNPEQILSAAVDVALRPAAGPVVIDIDPSATHSDHPPTTNQAGGELKEISAIVRAARLPVILIGQDGRNHREALDQLLANNATPVLMTYKGKGAIPDTAPNAAGLFTGVAADGALLRQADVIITIGLDTVELVPTPWTYDATVVSLGARAETHPYFGPTMEAVGNLDDMLSELRLESTEWPDGYAQSFRARNREALLDGPDVRYGVPPWTIVERARRHAAQGSVATVDAGAHMLATMPLWDTERPGEVLISSGLATMGFALPAAIAAAVVNPNRRIYCFVGDGGLGMVLAELETVARLQLPITVIVFNDSTLSLIELKQRPQGNGGRGAVGYGAVDFSMVAASAGIPAYRVNDVTDYETRLRASEASPGPMLLDVLVDGKSYPHVMNVVRKGLAASDTAKRVLGV
jgi:acetolactate synthase-1/2/3 large subunit